MWTVWTLTEGIWHRVTTQASQEAAREWYEAEAAAGRTVLMAFAPLRSDYRRQPFGWHGRRCVA